ncbi:hypothetical protein AB4144_49430, partial [Rhizobiaceae sp. 2RAB30]
MQPDQSLREALGAIGYRDVELAPLVVGAVSPIHRAVENASRIATADGRQPVFVKRRHDDMDVFIDLGRVAEASRKAGAIGIAPRLLHADSNSGI